MRGMSKKALLIPILGSKSHFHQDDNFSGKLIVACGKCCAITCNNYFENDLFC